MKKTHLSIFLILLFAICGWSIYKEQQKEAQRDALCARVAILLDAQKHKEALQTLQECIKENVPLTRLAMYQNPLLQKTLLTLDKIDASLHEPPLALLQAMVFVETLFPDYIASSKYYLLPEETGLRYAIEYDPQTKSIFIHLDKVIGEGHEKVVTLSILYSPSFAIVARAKQPDNQDQEIEITKLLQSAPGIFEIIACTHHLEQNIPYSTVFSRLYTSGSLQDLFDKKIALTLREKLEIAQKIATGIQSIHEKQIAHRDLGARNYFVSITEKDHVRTIDIAIADLGRAQYISKLAKKNPQGNFGYAAPEAVFLETMQGKDYFASDIFAIGCVFYQLLHEKRTEWHKKYFAKDPQDPEKVYKEFVSLLDDTLAKRQQTLATISFERARTPSEEFEALILQMLEISSQKRPTAQELKKRIDDILEQSAHGS